MTSKQRIQEIQRLVGAGADGVIGRETLTRFALNFSKNRVQTIHFFAQIHHESGGFTIARENMSYSAPRIIEIFGIGKHSARVTLAESTKLQYSPYALAERVYGLGNPSKARELGNSKVGDGFKYRGGGALQCTGGSDYKRYGGNELYNNPDLIGTSKYYITTAISEFDVRKTWDLAKDLSEASLLAVTRRVNGGTNGLVDRRNKLKYYDSLWDIDTNSVVIPAKKAVTLANLNLRSSAVSGSVILVIPKGTSVEVIRSVNNWSEVKVSGKVGWVSNQYIK